MSISDVKSAADSVLGFPPSSACIRAASSADEIGPAGTPDLSPFFFEPLFLPVLRAPVPSPLGSAFGFFCFGVTPLLAGFGVVDGAVGLL